MIKINAAFPLYVTKDVAAQRDFYCKVFGFEAVFFDPEFYVHLVNPANGIEIGFMLDALPTQPDFLHPTAQPEGMVISFEVDNASQAYKQARNEGLDIAFELKQEPWNQTHFMVRDPAGLIIDIVEDSNQPDHSVT